MSGYKDRLISLNTGSRHKLERVQLKFVGTGWRIFALVLIDRDVGIIRRNSNLVSDL